MGMIRRRKAICGKCAVAYYVDRLLEKIGTLEDPRKTSGKRVLYFRGHGLVGDRRG